MMYTRVISFLVCCPSTSRIRVLVLIICDLAGTLIFPNVWAMHHDENVYPNPDEFIPERFLEKDGKTPVMIPETKELGQHAFGFGRRSCIGYPIAK